MKRRIGIMGGTFDPIHMGHLITAEMVRADAHLDEILFIPSARPPHKDGARAASAEDRLIMTAYAVAENPHFSVSDIELKRDGPSYTVDTITQLRSNLGDTELFFITGADAMNDLYLWHEPEQLLRSCRFIVATRQGVPLDEVLIAEKFTAEERSHIEVLPTPCRAVLAGAAQPYPGCADAAFGDLLDRYSRTHPCGTVHPPSCSARCGGVY